MHQTVSRLATSFDAAQQKASILIHADGGDRALSFDWSEDDRWIARLDTHFAGVDRIGLIVPTSLEGISCWKAILLSGRTPVFLQYPTAKLSRAYWRSEIEAAISAMAIAGIVHQGELADPGLPLPSLDLATATELGAVPPRRPFIDGHAIQLSSGTTGFRKGIALSMADVARHVEDYNQVLRLDAADCVVSWLPLYHDMGFIACFLMPVLTGARVVMVDPMTWVRRPQLLFELIEQHRGTVCFMPNFAFQVMATRGRMDNLDLSSMRRWVSAGEPTRPDTMVRFLEATRTAPEIISNLYGTAENIFAVTQSEGLHTQQIGGSEIVSCGPPIPSTSLKIVAGEVHVRSPYSLQHYEAADPVVDAEGYYATGDLGEIIDGELYIHGRKHDVMIQAGRKFLLNDLDHEIGLMVPESAGRICLIDHYNEALGTDQPVCLIEHDRFWVKRREADLIEAIRDRLGLEMMTVEFVPPGFITKTSSGKMARGRTREHYLQVDAYRRQVRVAVAIAGNELRDEISGMFPGLLPDVPFEEQLDSLGLVNLSIVLQKAGIELSPEHTLAGLPIELSPADAPDAETAPVLRVVCWVDLARIPDGAIQQALFDLGRQLGVFIHCRFVAAPPAPVVLSDLIFEDYFLARDNRREKYDSVTSVLAILRDADLIITDDIVQMLFPWDTLEPQSYPRISHRFEPEPLAQFLAVRWAVYSESHHLIATEVVHGLDLSPQMINRGIDDIEEYLNVPIVRLGVVSRHLPHTKDWQVHCIDPRLDAYPADQIDDQAVFGAESYNALHTYFAGLFPLSNLRRGAAVDKWIMPDQVHFCGAVANRELVDFVLDRYDSFLVLGKPGSIPYLSMRASRLGKKLTFRFDLECPPDEDYECVLQTGSYGEAPATDKPIFQLMDAGWVPQARNVPPEVLEACPAWIVPARD